jgi:transposase-like protein
MAGKNYSHEFKRVMRSRYRDTEGATITQIAAELGVSEATLSAWCKAAGVLIRHRKPGSGAVPALSLRLPDYCDSIVTRHADLEVLGTASSTLRMVARKALSGHYGVRIIPPLVLLSMYTPV